MDILLDNLSWMTFNALLAFLGLIFGLIFLRVRHFFIRGLFFILWILFLPNTIYLVTDLQYFPEQFAVLGFSNQAMLLAQYMIIFLLGIITFVAGLSPLEKILSKIKDKILVSLIIIFSNYLIAFAVVLGKIERISSWYVFTEPQNVIKSSLNVLESPILLAAIIVFGTLINLIYFAFRKRIHRLK